MGFRNKTLELKKEINLKPMLGGSSWRMLFLSKQERFIDFFLNVEIAAGKFAWHPFKGCYLLINNYC